ncbi:cytochrome P450 [Streptomyces xiamenensis]
MTVVASLPLAPGALPLLGHAVPLVRRPLDFVSSLPAHGGLVRIRMGTRSVVMVCDPQLTRQVLLNDSVFDKGGPLFERGREVAGNSLLSCPHDMHRRQRRLCQPAFHTDRFPGYNVAFADLAENLAKSWQDRQIVDVTEALTRLTAEVAVETMFARSLPPSIASQILDDFIILSEGIFRRAVTPSTLNRLPVPANRRYRRALTRLKSTVFEIIAARRSATTDHGDLLSSLANAVDPDSKGGRYSLSDEELVDQVIIFLYAGSDTTAAAVAWALHLLAQRTDLDILLYEEARKALRDTPLVLVDPGSLEMANRVLAESLRMYPPAWLTTRTVASDTELGGVVLPAGTIVGYSPYLVHRLPDLYKEPDTFDPDRWLSPPADRSAYIPFGAGARKCIGDRFGMAQAALILTAIISRWRLIPAGGRPVRAAAKVTLMPKGLHMRVLARERPY